jgi:hypothetical protein
MSLSPFQELIQKGVSIKKHPHHGRPARRIMWLTNESVPHVCIDKFTKEVTAAYEARTLKGVVSSKAFLFSDVREVRKGACPVYHPCPSSPFLLRPRRCGSNAGGLCVGSPHTSPVLSLASSFHPPSILLSSPSSFCIFFHPTLFPVSSPHHTSHTTLTRARVTTPPRPTVLETHTPLSLSLSGSRPSCLCTPHRAFPIDPILPPFSPLLCPPPPPPPSLPSLCTPPTLPQQAWRRPSSSGR